MSDTEFQVHTESLDAAAKTLDNLADLAQKKIIPEMYATLNISSQGGSGGTEADAIFGGFEAAREVAAKQSAYYQTALASTQSLVKMLRNSAEATRKVAENYRTAEAASHASVQDVGKLLSGAGDAPPRAGSSHSVSAPAYVPRPNDAADAGSTSDSGY